MGARMSFRRAVMAIAMASFAAPAAADPPCDVPNAEVYAEYCEPSLTWEGCCNSLFVFWCDPTGVTCRLSCVGHASCGWNAEQGYYWCETDGEAEPTGTWPLDCPDNDGDFWHTGGDCDDNNPDVNPSAPEICDGVPDNNCDGVEDHKEFDDDGDGYSECDDPYDCNDTDDSFYPGAYDICGDGLDQDCMNDFETEADQDEDGVPICDGDCDDHDADRSPELTEICDDSIDNDCDEAADSYDDECVADDDDDDDDMAYDPRGGPYGMRCRLGEDPAISGHAALLLALLLTGLLRRSRR